ncbi:unnamed protein product [Chironomus riparius]|uniref:Uncharacterized protein n=1 Tax=Chironomus riparius TaxID=315576 RepID=A0A9N9RPS1_9DIPT|nr:unnamed protein product [Chironomus riparius]
MSVDKIRHFYITVSVTLTSVLLLLIIYGCCIYRKRRLEDLNKRNEVLARRRSRGLGDGQTNSTERHLHQKLIN